jgi:hypothetical protein
MGSSNEREDLPEAVVAFLNGSHIVVGATIDDDGYPYTMIMNSAIAVDPKTVRFALDHRTSTLRFVRERPAMAIEIVGDGFVVAARGTARILRERMEHAPVPSALVQFDIQAVKSDLPPGVGMKPPHFDWGALGEYMRGVEPAMFKELRSCNPEDSDG